MQSVLFYISLSTLKFACHFIAQSLTVGDIVTVLLQALTITYCPCYSKVVFTYKLLSLYCSLAPTLVHYEHAEKHKSL